MTNALHFTDCGKSTENGRGTDTQARIEALYDGWDINGKVYRETTPIGIAFAAATSAEVAKRLGRSQHPRLHAVNCASRTGHQGKTNAEGGPCLAYRSGEGVDYVGYGEDVFRWLRYFSQSVQDCRARTLQERPVVELQSSTKLDIANYRNGTQFRSLEHLVPTHALWLLQREIPDRIFETLNGTSDGFTFERFREPLNQQKAHKTRTIVLPSDEFGNGRVILPDNVYAKALREGEIIIPQVSDDPIPVNESLTSESEGLNLWRSSNRLPNDHLVVANVGYAWLPEEFGGKGERIEALNQKLEPLVGAKAEIEIRKTRERGAKVRVA
ncbi:MAG TPA: hypothetical protein VIT68_00810 [Candidatus Gracilibacteria bacterium]